MHKSFFKLAFQYFIRVFRRGVMGSRQICLTLICLKRDTGEDENPRYRYRFFFRQVFQRGMCLEVRSTYKYKADDKMTCITIEHDYNYASITNNNTNTNTLLHTRTQTQRHTQSHLTTYTSIHTHT